MSDSASFSAPASGSAAEASPAQVPRIRVWSGSLGLVVPELAEAGAQVAAALTQFEGFVENETDSSEQSKSLELRIPTKNFKSCVTQLERLGNVEYKNISSEDITDQYVDTEARLANQIALRDRLRALLTKATAVKDVIAIETELTRIQTEIDSMQGRLNAMKGQVDYARLSLSLRRKPIRGPLGVVFDAVGWTIEKLFVIRD